MIKESRNKRACESWPRKCRSNRFCHYQQRSIFLQTSHICMPSLEKGTRVCIVTEQLEVCQTVLSRVIVTYGFTVIVVTTRLSRYCGFKNWKGDFVNSAQLITLLASPASSVVVNKNNEVDSDFWNVKLGSNSESAIWHACSLPWWFSEPKKSELEDRAPNANSCSFPRG